MLLPRPPVFGAFFTYVRVRQVPNCTWQSGNITGSYLGMYCNDDNWSAFNYVWTCEYFHTGLQIPPSGFESTSLIRVGGCVTKQGSILISASPTTAASCGSRIRKLCYQPFLPLLPPPPRTEKEGDRKTNTMGGNVQRQLLGQLP